MRLTRAGLNPIEILRKRLDRRAARAAPYVITHSHFTRDDLRRNYGIDAEVVRLGVDVDAFTPTAERPDTPPYLLSIGALHPLKGHRFVIEAVGRIAAHQRPRLVLIGDRGHEGPTLERRARELGVDLDLRSNVPFTELVATLQGATVVVCAQIHEPFGLVPLEAMASGRPVVAVADGGLRESVRDGETGLLVARDPDAIAAAIARLLHDPALRARFGAAGRADVEANWRWERYAAEVDRVLRERATTGGMRG
jgi:glycosyltransferase involved in cell wall biosynthesis